MDVNFGGMRQNGPITTPGPQNAQCKIPKQISWTVRSDAHPSSPGHSPAAELPFGSTVLAQRDLFVEVPDKGVPQLLLLPFCLLLPDGLVRFAPDPGRWSRAKGWINVFGELEQAASRQGKS